MNFFFILLIPHFDILIILFFACSKPVQWSIIRRNTKRHITGAGNRLLTFYLKFIISSLRSRELVNSYKKNTHTLAKFSTTLMEYNKTLSFTSINSSKHLHEWKIIYEIRFCVSITRQSGNKWKSRKTQTLVTHTWLTGWLFFFAYIQLSGVCGTWMSFMGMDEWWVNEKLLTSW